jgi:frataxin-like iron-binding protein CyaY
MDTREFLLTADETLEALARRIDEQVPAGVDATAEDGILTLEFSHGNPLVLAVDRTAHTLVLDEPRHTFHYNSVEEDWLEVETELPLADVLARLLGARLGHTVSIVED